MLSVHRSQFYAHVKQVGNHMVQEDFIKVIKVSQKLANLPVIYLLKLKYVKLESFDDLIDLTFSPFFQVIIYGDELVSKSLAYHLSNTELASNVLVIRGNGTQNGKRMPSFNPHLNSFYMNHLIVSNPRSSLLIRHSTELFNMTKCGAIYLAQTEERVKSFKRMISISKLFIPKEYGSIELLSPEGEHHRGVTCELW